MTIIKAAAAIGVARYAAPAALIATPLPPPVDPELEALRTRVTRLERDLAAAALAQETAVAAAREDGAAAVLLDHEAHLEAVAGALAAARHDWDAVLQGTERLAVALARTALERMFAEPDDLARRVANTIRLHLADIGNHAVVRLRVSPMDFPAGADLASLADAGGIARDRAVADPALAAGAARLDLLLGHADLDLRAQAEAIDAALAALVAA
jgi:type III secretion protein L